MCVLTQAMLHILAATIYPLCSVQIQLKTQAAFCICSTHCTVIFEVSLHNVSSMDLLIITNCQVQQSISELILNRSRAS
jgi:hypothetical protein